MDNLFATQRWFLLIVFLVTGFLLYLLGPILSPFLVGALLAYLTDPVADRLELAGFTRTTSVVIVFVILSTLFTLLILLFIPKLSHQIQVMVRQIPAVIALFEEKVIPAIQAYLGEDISFGDLSTLKQLITSHWEKTGDIMSQIAGGITR